MGALTALKDAEQSKSTTSELSKAMIR